MLVFFATAFFLGIVHAFGPDHLAAVSTFVGERSRVGPALMVSVRWGSAHMLSILIVGATISALSLRVPTRFAPLAEVAVGAVLVLVGVTALWRNVRARKLHVHRHRHESRAHLHPHSHAGGAEHVHDHAVTFTGAVHGLAGTVPALALFPVATLRSPWLVGWCLLVFGFGVIVGMAAYCFALSRFLGRIPDIHLSRWVQPVFGAGSCGLGVLWIVRIYMVAPL